MSNIKVQRDVNGIKDLCIIEPVVHSDERGSFFESYNEKNFLEEGIDAHFVQDNEVFSKKGVIRGFHVNQNHPHAKLIRVLDGEIFDVVIDLRKDSITYKKWFAINLSSDNKKQLFIPEGFGHGYQALTDARIIFKVTTHWIPGDEIGFAWNSKEFGIEWPLKSPILCEKDDKSIDLSEIDF